MTGPDPPGPGDGTRPAGPDDAVRLPDRRMIAHLVTPPPSAVAAGPARTAAYPAADDPASHAGVRPFVVTQGRTAPVDDRLRIETQVVATPTAATNGLTFEYRRIVELCATPLSIAEIGAALAMSLGVVRVLVADLAAVGAVTVQEETGAVSRAAIERILERVHAL